MVRSQDSACGRSLPSRGDGYLGARRLSRRCNDIPGRRRVCTEVVGSSPGPGRRRRGLSDLSIVSYLGSNISVAARLDTDSDGDGDSGRSSPVCPVDPEGRDETTPLLADSRDGLDIREAPDGGFGWVIVAGRTAIVQMIEG